MPADICRWQPPQEYDVIVAWDSTFHVPHRMQRGVVAKLCGALAAGGAVLFTAGGVDGEITGRMGGGVLDGGRSSTTAPWMTGSI